MDSGTWPDGVESWNKKRVMVTGGAGFLGRHVVAKQAARAVDEVKPPVVVLEALRH